MNSMSKIIVVAFATGSRDIETWAFDAHDDLCKKFCETIAGETGRNVWIIEGKVIGNYSIDCPVSFKSNE